MEIDNDKLPPEPINDKTKVEISGEVENDNLKSLEIDVDHVKVIEEQRVSGGPLRPPP